MSGNGAAIAGVAGRYASALFELCEEQGATDDVLADVVALKAAVASSAELQGAIADPSVSRADLGRAVDALAAAMRLKQLTANALGLMASKRRLSHLPGMLDAFAALVAEKLGDTTVEVSSAHPLTDAQRDALASSLSGALGKSVHLMTVVKPELIGGLVLKIGSKMIDASIASKLTRLQHAMKEVG